MKRSFVLALSALLLLAAITPAALAVDLSAVCYPTSVTRSEDGTEIRKVYDLAYGEDPAGIPRSDFEQDGVHYTMTDLLKQELPEYEERRHTETVSVESKYKDMESVLALLPQEREFVTGDGLAGTLTLQLETVQVEAAGYGSSTREVSATRSYPNLAGQDTRYIPKTIEEDGRILALQSIDWQADGSERYTAAATYTGSATSSYVTGYMVTAEYTGTVSRIALNRVRYVAIFQGTPPEPVIELPLPEAAEASPAAFQWTYVLVPLGIVAAGGGAIVLALFLKRRREAGEEGDT